MSTDARGRLEDSATDRSTDLEARDVRALEEYLTVLDDVGKAKGAEDLYAVVSGSGSQYVVDVDRGTCECPDHEHRNARCKHIRRAEIAAGTEPIHADVLRAVDVDPDLGEHVDGPTVLASDGGVIGAGEDEDREAADEDDVDECECDELPEGVPCWPCYREGAEFDR